VVNKGLILLVGDVSIHVSLEIGPISEEKEDVKFVANECVKFLMFFIDGQSLPLTEEVPVVKTLLLLCIIALTLSKLL
jgi:hypothetical protein